jgi:hypothetical protein
MLTVIWGIDGFHVVDLMIEQHIHNTRHFLSHILKILLPTVFSEGRKPHSHRLSLHLDNCSVHRSKAYENFFAENSIIRVPHQPDSPDVAFSDFWLFGRMKAVLTGQQFQARGSSHWHSGISE